MLLRSVSAITDIWRGCCYLCSYFAVLTWQNPLTSICASYGLCSRGCYLYEHKLKYYSVYVCAGCWFIVAHSSGLYPPLFPFRPLPPHPLRKQCSSGNGQAFGYWVLWGINQLTGCHGGGWGSLRWCTGFLIKNFLHKLFCVWKTD